MFRDIDESIVCIQSKLNFYNQQTNWLTRWFSIEYSLLFDLLLPDWTRGRTRSRSAGLEPSQDQRAERSGSLGSVQRH